MSQLDKFKQKLDEIASEATGQLTRAQAFETGVCKSCRQQPRFYTELGKKEYYISGMCEPCFDRLMTHPDDCCGICEMPVEFHTYNIIGKTHEFTVKTDEQRIDNGPDDEY